MCWVFPSFLVVVVTHFPSSGQEFLPETQDRIVSAVLDNPTLVNVCGVPVSLVRDRHQELLVKAKQVEKLRQELQQTQDLDPDRKARSRKKLSTKERSRMEQQIHSLESELYAAGFLSSSPDGVGDLPASGASSSDQGTSLESPPSPSEALRIRRLRREGSGLLPGPGHGRLLHPASHSPQKEDLEGEHVTFQGRRIFF